MPFDYADLLDLLPSRRSRSGTIDALALPFPVAVFGTLRRGCWNHRFMETAGTMDRGLLHGFYCEQLHLVPTPTVDNAAPVEIYGYTATEFAKAIVPIDRLESFSPEASGHPKPWGYVRTLMYVEVIPTRVANGLMLCGTLRDEAFPKGRPDLDGVRVVERQPATVEKCAPCWVYSSDDANAKHIQAGGRSVIWSPSLGTLT